MANSYSIAEARDQLARLVRESETCPVELTRRGRPVAVIISRSEFERLQGSGGNFWDRFVEFRDRAGVAQTGVDAEVFEDVRDRGTGRKVNW
jgi:prevent-host-death family protein